MHILKVDFWTWNEKKHLHNREQNEGPTFLQLCLWMNSQVFLISYNSSSFSAGAFVLAVTSTTRWSTVSELLLNASVMILKETIKEPEKNKYTPTKNTKFSKQYNTFSSTICIDKCHVRILCYILNKVNNSLPSTTLLGFSFTANWSGFGPHKYKLMFITCWNIPSNTRRPTHARHIEANL